MSIFPAGVGEQCAATDQFEQMLGSVQQGIINSSSDGIFIPRFQHDPIYFYTKQ